MSEAPVSKRERQIMDVIFQLGEASAADVHQRMADPPSYTAVRTMLRLLEDKGVIRHYQDGRRYIYQPCKSPEVEGRSALRRVLDVFFSGSLGDALAAHLNDPKLQLDAEDLKRLHALIDQAEESPPAKRKPKQRRRKKR